MPPSHRPISGRYRGREREVAVELRVDVDGRRPTGRVSADYFEVSDQSLEYRRSMRVDSPRVSFAAGQVRISGTAAFTGDAPDERISVTIELVPAQSPPAPATLHQFDWAGRLRTTYVCEFESPFLRKVELEEAIQRGVTRVQTYDTAVLPSARRGGVLTIVDAFREAGIELLADDPPAMIDTSRAGPNATWSDAELHAAMEASFTRWRDRPQWAVWLLHATDHDDPQLAGVMFDRRELPRQGCAVFYGSTPRSDARVLRYRLHNCVHELGHAFNLLHSWSRSLTVPPLPSRPSAASWMNYPTRFPGGPNAYWSRFAFEFDETELVHLRHGFRDAVIMGGAPLPDAGIAPRERDWDAQRLDPGLRLRLIPPSPVPVGVPVTVAAELSATTIAARSVPAVFGPQMGSLDVLVRRPDGEESVFVPLFRHCRHDEPVTLCAADPPLRSRPFIHYGQDGFAFPTPGRYVLRARFAGYDGRIALSDPVSVQVLAPMSRGDHDIQEMISNDHEVGVLTTLMGSDARELRDGDQKLSEIRRRFPDHPAAATASLVQGTNFARTFKSVAVDGSVDPRPARPETAARLIGAVIDVPAVARAVSGVEGEAAQRVAVGRALARIGAKPGMPSALDGFIASRRQEMSTVREVVHAGAVRLGHAVG